MAHPQSHTSHNLDDNDLNMVEVWLRADPSRWIAGIFAGWLAGAVAMGVAGIVASMGGYDFLMPVKLMATPFLGNAATAAGNSAAVAVGFALVEAIAGFWGFVFAHFVFTNAIGSLLAMGLAWGAFTWIFTWNLFLQSFRDLNAAKISAGPAFPVCMAYGLSMVTVAVFDRMFRRAPSTR